MTKKAWGLGVACIVILALVAVAVVWHDKFGTSAPQGPLTYEWQFADKSTAEQSKTQVTLVAGGQSYTIGTYNGTCSEQDSDFLPNEVSKVVCWFAGGGNEVGVFEQAPNMYVKVGDLDEGSAEVAGFRGNFQIVKTLR